MRRHARPDVCLRAAQTLVSSGARCIRSVRAHARACCHPSGFATPAGKTPNALLREVPKVDFLADPRLSSAERIWEVFKLF